MELAVIPSKNTILLRALVNLILGAILLIWPGLTLLVLVYAFAINILIVGLATLFEPAFDKKRSALLTTVLGLAGIVAGIYLVAKPGITAELIGLLIALWVIVFGITDIYLGFSGKGAEKGNWLFVVVGILSVLLGIYVLSAPIGGILSIIWIIGWYSVIAGFVLGILGLLFYPKSK
jgi:uncharacterized membrane protein HdeD (DUF308 family)